MEPYRCGSTVKMVSCGHQSARCRKRLVGPYLRRLKNLRGLEWVPVKLEGCCTGVDGAQNE